MCAHTGVGEEQQSRLWPRGDEVIVQKGSRDSLTFIGDGDSGTDWDIGAAALGGQKSLSKVTFELSPKGGEGSTRD